MNNIIWAEILKEMPWVKYLKEGAACERYRSGAPMRLYYPNEPGLKKFKDEAEFKALQKKWRCRNSARWHYKALRSSWGTTGTFCWSHVLSNVDMGEEARIDKWLKRHHPGLRWRS